MKMKYIITLLIAMFILPLVAWKKIKHQETVVVRDCTGVYLRLNGKDYQVCNRDALTAYPTGTKVMATFRQIARCKSAEDDVVCMMLHKNEGWVEVLRVIK